VIEKEDSGRERDDEVQGRGDGEGRNDYDSVVNLRMTKWTLG